MFSWHETTLRGLCRLAFGLLVAVPTCAVLLAIVWCCSPLSLEYHRRVLANSLALDVELERVSFPRPGVTLYEGVSIVDPQTEQPLARCRALEWQNDGQNTSLICAQAELLDSSRLDLLGEIVDRHLRSQAGSTAVFEVVAPQLTLYLADGLGPQTLSNLHARLQAQADGPQGVLEFHLAGDEQEEQAAPARVTSLRSPAGQGATTSITVETGALSLPSRLVALCCPGWETWGPGSSFRGRLSWQQHADGWTGEVSGQITDIDLQRVVSDRTKHRLTGLAEVQLDRARAEKGRLVEAAGIIKAGPGVIGRRLLAAAAIQLHAAGNDPAVAQNDSADYEEMAIGFAIDEHGLTIEGLCAEAPGALLVSHDRTPMLDEPKPGPQSLLGLVRLLNNSGELVPADRSAQALLGVLPVVVAPAVDSPMGPQARFLRGSPLRSSPLR
jgi:hypothetical protein